MRVVVVAAALVAGAPALRAGGLPAPATAPVETPEQAIQRDLQLQQGILTGPGAKPEQREQAAERLLSRQRPDARAILLRALSDSSTQTAHEAQVAVATALAGDPRPDPAFVDPLRRLLEADPVTVEAAASALASFANRPEGADVLRSLTDLARDMNRPTRARASAVRRIGAFVQKPAAAFLMELIDSPDQDSQVRNAAANALADMTGLEQNGQDVQAWRQWWAAQVNKPDAQWLAEVRADRSERYAQARREYQDLAKRMRDVLMRTYQNRVSDAQRSGLLLDWLKDVEPSIRGIAAEIVRAEKSNGVVIPDAVTAQLRLMVGDSAVEVRAQVVAALRDINDVGALDPLLAQLAVETDPDVKVAIASTLGRLKQAKAVDALLALLDDRSLRVQEAAAQALRALGETVYADRNVANRVAAKLRAKLQQVNGQPGTERLRAALLGAAAQLHDASMLRTFQAALDPNDPRNTVGIRIEAVRGLGSMTEPADKDLAAQELVNAMRRENADPPVRAEALSALQRVGSYAQAEAVYERMTRDDDQSIREAAWPVLLDLLRRPEVSAETLQRSWVNKRFDEKQFQRDPKRQRVEIEHRLAVLEVVRAKLIAATPVDESTLAAVQQNIGDTCMKLGEWDKAIASYRAALDYSVLHNAQRVTIAQISEQLITALLRAGDYAGAVQFAGQRITADAQDEYAMGRAIKEEVDRLRKDGNLRAAGQLIDAALDKMQPPLRGANADTLREYREAIRREPQSKAAGAGAPVAGGDR